MSRQTILFESAQPTLMVTLFWSIMVVWVLNLTTRRGQWHRRWDLRNWVTLRDCLRPRGHLPLLFFPSMICFSIFLMDHQCWLAFVNQSITYTSSNIHQWARRFHSTKLVKLTLIGKLILKNSSWKTHPENFRNFSLPGQVLTVKSQAVLLENLFMSGWVFQ